MVLAHWNNSPRVDMSNHYTTDAVLWMICNKNKCVLLLGDAVFFHSNTLHMSEINTSTKRRIGFPIAYNRANNNPTKMHHHPSYTPINKVK